MPWFLRMTLTLFPIIALIQIYVFLGVKFSLREIWSSHKKKWNTLFWSFLVFFNIFPLSVIILYLFGHIYSLYIFQPEISLLDFLFSFPFWWGLISTFEIFPYFVLSDLLFLFVRRFKSGFSWSRVLAIIKISLILFIFSYVGIRLYVDTYRVRLSDKKIQFNNIPNAFDDLRITLVGDIQVDRYTQEKKLEALQKQIRATNSDLLFFSGDLVTSGQYYIDQGLTAICSLTANGGKFACIGDHDFWANPRKISQGMSACGWSFLRNSHEIISWKEKTIIITGITEIYSKKMSSMDLSEILSQAPAADFKILLLHQPSPRLIDIAVQYGYHLILAGHTHGGQIQFKPFGKTLTPSMLETPYFSGTYQLGKTVVAVTNGIGLTLAPVRYHAAAEVTLLRISSQ